MTFNNRLFPGSSIGMVSGGGTMLFLPFLSCTLCLLFTASWTLIHQEDFTEALDERGAKWELETYDQPFDTIMDDSGDWYRNDYGNDFDQALQSFDTYRKEYLIGTDGWLTASLSARDWAKDGLSNDDEVPQLFIEDFGDAGNVLTMNIKDHTGGAILRPTKALPEAYRIEYKLKFLDFGGKKNGSIEYDDGHINGYSPEGCKTQHPWGEGSGSRGWTGDASVPYCEWQSVREGPYGYNGFHFMTIVDFADPAPRNNHFWHYRRKLLMDSFSVHPDRVGDGSGGQVCDASTNQYYDYKDSESWTTVNMWISGLPGTWTPNPGGLAGNSQRFITECNGQQATRGLQSAGELQPEFLPDRFYTFAVERNATGYTLEASGHFVRGGFRTFRFFRPFIVDDEPIWHYNVKANEYDGRYNNDLKQENWAHGSQTWPDQWPAESSYPDYFVIGAIYTNVYEGRASLTDIRYYEPDSPEQDCEPKVLLASGEELIESTVIENDGSFLLLNEDGNLQVWYGRNGIQESLVWESGEIGVIEDGYVTMLQGDGNLIVSKRDTDGAKTPLWMTLSVNAHGKFYLVHECEAKGGGVAIYRSLPGEGGYPVWIRNAIHNNGQTQIPTSKPTSVDPTPTPSSPPIVTPFPASSSSDAPIMANPSEPPSAIPTDTSMESGSVQGAEGVSGCPHDGWLGWNMLFTSLILVVAM